MALSSTVHSFLCRMSEKQSNTIYRSEHCQQISYLLELNIKFQLDAFKMKATKCKTSLTWGVKASLSF